MDSVSYLSDSRLQRKHCVSRFYSTTFSAIPKIKSKIPRKTLTIHPDCFMIFLVSHFKQLKFYSINSNNWRIDL